MTEAALHLEKDLLLFIAAAARSLQSCLTLCDPIDSSPPGSPVPGILQARILEWVALLQGTFLTQSSKLGLPHCRQILYHLATSEALVPGIQGPNKAAVTFKELL